MEETIVWKDIKGEEIQKYYIDDKWSEEEKINYIIKKGYPCQKETLIKKIPLLFYKHQSSILEVIHTILNRIELSDKSIQILFSLALKELLETFPLHKHEDHSSVIKLILLHYFQSMSTLEKGVSDEYILNFISIVETYFKLDYKINIPQEFVDFITGWGRFGEGVGNRKLSVFLGICVLRITNNKHENSIIQRIEFLSQDNERWVKYEFAYQMRFLIEINSEEECKSKYAKYLEIYSGEEEIGFKATLVQSYFYNGNFRKFQADAAFVKALTRKIKEIFSTKEHYSLWNDFDFLIQIFIYTIDVSLSDSTCWEYFIGWIVQFLKSFFITNEIKTTVNITVTLRVDYGITNFHKIAKVLGSEKYFPFWSECFNSLMKYSWSTTEQNKTLFYTNWYLLVPALPCELVTKSFYTLIFPFFEELWDFNLIGNPTTLSQASSFCKNPLFVPHFNEEWLINFDKFIFVLITKPYDDLLFHLLSKLQNIVGIVYNIKRLPVKISMITAWSYLPKYVMWNYVKYENYEKYIEIIVNMIKDYWKQGINYCLEQELTWWLVQCYKYSKSRNDLFTYIDECFYKSSSFFRRRIFIHFTLRLIASCSVKFSHLNNVFNNFCKTWEGDINDSKYIIIQGWLKFNIHNTEIYDIVKRMTCGEDIEWKKLQELFVERKCWSIDGEDDIRVKEENKIFEIEKNIIESMKKEDIWVWKTKGKQRLSNACLNKKPKIMISKTWTKGENEKNVQGKTIKESTKLGTCNTVVSPGQKQLSKSTNFNGNNTTGKSNMAKISLNKASSTNKK